LFQIRHEILNQQITFNDLQRAEDLKNQPVAPLRDAKVVLTSCPQGYKLPVSIEGCPKNADTSTIGFGAGITKSSIHFITKKRCLTTKS